MAYLAELRYSELLRNGRRSLHPDANDSDRDSDDLIYRLKSFGHGEDGTVYTTDVENYFRQARENAQEWRDHRTAFMVEKLTAGFHPDTNPDFWDGYEEACSTRNNTPTGTKHRPTNIVQPLSNTNQELL